MNHDDKSTLRVELSEAKAWAAWFAAERDWLQKQLRRACLESMTADWQSEENWQKLTKVRELHAPLPDPDHGQRCKHCSNFGFDNSGEPWPCETIRILDGEA